MEFAKITVLDFLHSMQETRITEKPGSGEHILFKGIVSRDFGTLFLISLERFEGRNRAGSGLFFILMTFSFLIFKKLCLCGKDPSK
jgi:hypothetical protein